jgi:hypothetical protein
VGASLTPDFSSIIGLMAVIIDIIMKVGFVLDKQTKKH